MPLAAPAVTFSSFTQPAEPSVPTVNSDPMDQSVPDEPLTLGLEAALLGGPRVYTRLEVAELAGTPVQRLEKLWRAMGFADVDDETRLFTDDDAAAVRTLDEFAASGFLDVEREASMARVLGQGMARMAEWQVRELRAALQAARGDIAAEEQLEPPAVEYLVTELLPRMQRLQDHIWRRHLVSIAGRAFSTEGELDAVELVVGFADLVGFTSLSRTLRTDELAAVVEGFESRAAEVIAVHRGRVVKTMGDGVLFVADDAVSGAEIALGLLEAMVSDETLPALRVGLAKGTVLTRLGDVYSSTVNLASRLTGLAKPNSVLVDGAFAHALDDDPRYALLRLGRVSVRGLERQRPYVLRRARREPVAKESCLSD